MEVWQAVRRRRMVRNFQERPVDPEVVDRVCDAARRAPSAGHSQGIDLLVLDTTEATRRYWDVSLPHPARRRFRWQGLLRAPVLIVVLRDQGAYLRRYAEPDKAGTRLSAPERWPVPYWDVDAGMATMALLLAVVDAGLGACFFGLFDRERAVLDAFGVPPDRRAVGTVAVGHPAPDEAGRSATRPRRPLDDVVHRNRW